MNPSDVRCHVYTSAWDSYQAMAKCTILLHLVLITLLVMAMVDKHWSLWRPEFITEELSELGGQGGAVQLTLSQSGVTDYAQCINTSPLRILRPSYGPVVYKYSTYVRYVSSLDIRIIIGVLKISDSAFPVWSYW